MPSSDLGGNVTSVKDVTLEMLAGFIFRAFNLLKPSGFFLYLQV